jgi:hypothetical protein
MTGERGRLQSLSDVENYIWRGPRLENYSFLRFIVDTYEEVVPNEERSNYEEDVRAEQDDDSQSDEEFDDNFIQRTNQRSRYTV